MIKKWGVGLCLLWCLMLVACASAPDKEITEPEGAILNGKIVYLEESSLLLAGDSDTATLCLVDLADLPLTDKKGNSIAADDLCCGMMVAVSYDGTMEDIYPMRLSQPTALTVQSDGDDMVGFYLMILRDLYAVDAGLNSNITQMAFDLEAVHNLTAAEKEALLYLAWQEFQLETYAATFADLQANGTITEERPRFADGLLITFADEPMENNRFTFQVQKWRSGTGAYYFTDCTAKKKNGIWQYTIGAEAIS